MKFIVAFAVLCFGAVLAKTIEVQVLEGPVKISTKEVTVEVIDSNLSLAEQVNAAEVLSTIYGHFDNNQDRAEGFTEMYKYLAPECVWYVAVNSESVHANKENGKTGFILMKATDTTGGIGWGGHYRAQVANFYVFSAPANGAVCSVA